MFVPECVEARVKELTPYGVYLECSEGSECNSILVTLSELSWRAVSHPTELYQKGDLVRVKVMGWNDLQNHYVGSIKRLQPDPWQQLPFGANAVLSGEVVKNVAYGSFIMLPGGVEGLLHTDQGGGVLQPSTQVKVRVDEVTKESRRITLSLVREETA